MRAARVHRFGGPEEIIIDEVATPAPEPEEVLIRVKAAGVGKWDALVRSGTSRMPLTLPLVLGAEISGIVEKAGIGVSVLNVGDEVFGATNSFFTGGYAQYATAVAHMIEPKPKSLDFVKAASVPIAAVTAYDMLFTYARISQSQKVLIHGAAGSVGAFAVQLARRAGAHVIATARARDAEYVRGLGAERVIDFETEHFDTMLSGIDVVVDTVGGEVQTRSFGVMRRGSGILVSCVSRPNDAQAAFYHVRSTFFIVALTSDKLTAIAKLIDGGQLHLNVGPVLPLSDARKSHVMLETKASRPPGKMVLRVEA